MLLPVHPGLKPCGVFAGLNALLQEVILATCGGRNVDLSVMPSGLWAAVQANAPTLNELANLLAALNNLTGAERYDVWTTVRHSPGVQQLLCDGTCSIPQIPASVFGPAQKVVVHLFERTSKLRAVEVACDDSLIRFYTRYSAKDAPGNGLVCGMCGTDVLAQRRQGVAEEEQWRGPYDHLLAEAKYPLQALQPANLLPTCHHCNSKAKLAKDLLHDDQGNRRLSFDPWTESAHLMIRLGIVLQEVRPVVTVTFQPSNDTNAEKLRTWDKVYEIQQRVLGEFASLDVKLSEDLDLESFDEFKISLTTRQKKRSFGARNTPFNYWRAVLYRGMSQMPDEQLEKLRQLFSEVSNKEFVDCETTFGDLLPA